ncbi:DUF6138 family protein [Paenibacillus motobuensis]|uniref:DUF6138 family protein n=1 Tax=Paenibacillus TaxID=44249 RepID=UPI00203C468C|nr:MULTISPECIES: DUF6138 family protein [Paenibacillus]MCM3040013.1 DUF6138 family protein [Paenibacillus lutimineralis]MCM3647117.1 DUF6138 family protein [Paenibacillus motobuensis]
MNQYVEAFLDDVWNQIIPVYERESKRIQELKNRSRLQAGVNDYFKVSWKNGQQSGGYGTIYIDLYEPFDWSDSSYTVEAGSYIEGLMEMKDEALLEELYSALRAQVEVIFQSDRYGSRFFDYRMELILELERGSAAQHRQEVLINEHKLQVLKQELAAFIQSKVLAELPVRPNEDDEFFFARHLLNPQFFAQKSDIIDPLIQCLNDKHRTNRSRLEQWSYQYTSALREWAEKQFLERYFDRTGNFGQEWLLKEGAKASLPNADAMEFFLYAALQIGRKEPDTRKEYLELAKQLGSEQAANYLQQGSGRYESMRQGSLFQGKANDILQTIDIRIASEEEAAYREALDYVISLLEQGFPKGYKLTLRSKAKNYLPVKKLAKSQQHQFFANCVQYPGLFPRVAEYAEAAMEEFAWYGDVEPGEKSAMPGTYAVFGLGLYSEAYYPLVQRYMKLVDTEHQSVQDGYAEAFVEAHGVSVQWMPVLISILLGGNESAGAVKNIVIDSPELADALVHELAAKEDYQREYVLYRIFGSRSKLAQRVKKEASPLKDKLEKLLAWMR